MRYTLLVLALALLAPSAQAAEGMWPLNLLPQPALDALGLAPQPQRLMHSSVRLPNGSGSFVSAEGLVLTNHHVVSDCIDALSSAREPLQQRGFVARQRAQERRCPGMRVQVLQGIDDVTAQMLATAAEPAARKALVHALENTDCPKGEHCEVVALYGGALQHRHRYRVLDDVRLAMAPENQAANFGGDDDNFTYPRHAFDFALLRVYEAGGRVHRPSQWLRPAAQGPRVGEALMVSGHPYNTARLLTLAQLNTQREAVLPTQIAVLEAQLQAVRGYSERDAEARRQAVDLVAHLENSLKALRGELGALQQPGLMAAKQSDEARLRERAPSSQAWVEVAAVAQRARVLEPLALERALPMDSLPAQVLQALMQLGEAERPVAQRLDAFSGVEAAQQSERLQAEWPVYPALEQHRLAAYLTSARERLGAQDPWVQALWQGAASAEQAATAALQGTGMLQAAQRRALLSDPRSQAADPLVRWAQPLLPLLRATAQSLEREIQQPLAQQAQALAQARWAVDGRSSPPDATFTLRLSFGRLEDVRTAGLRHPPFTTFGGLWARADGFAQQPPFQLSPALQRARSRIDARTPLNFIASADIVGGNSGSPVLNARHEWVGVAFDGNLESLAGNFHYDATSNRMVVLHLRAIGVALRQVYPAAHLARELGL